MVLGICLRGQKIFALAKLISYNMQQRQTSIIVCEMMNREFNVPMEAPSAERDRKRLHEVARSVAMEHAALRSASCSEDVKDENESDHGNSSKDESFEQSADTSPVSRRKRRRMLQANMTEEERRAERRAANRRSAFESRQRRKILIEDLQETVQSLSKENAAIRKEADALKIQLQEAQQENRQLRLQQQLSNRLQASSVGISGNTSSLYGASPVTPADLNQQIHQMGFPSGVTGLWGGSGGAGVGGATALPGGPATSSIAAAAAASLPGAARGGFPGGFGARVHDHQLGLFGHRQLSAAAAAARLPGHAGIVEGNTSAAALLVANRLNTGGMTSTGADPGGRSSLEHQQAAADALLAEQAARAGILETKLMGDLHDNNNNNNNSRTL